MKIVMRLSMVLAIVLMGATVSPEAPLPVAARCVPKEGLPYAALTTKCDPAYLQAGCNRYAKTPGFGPATADPKVCKAFKTKDELGEYLKSLLAYTEYVKFNPPLPLGLRPKESKWLALVKPESADMTKLRFAGMGGCAVLCKTRLGSVTYAEALDIKTVKKCDDASMEAQKVACATDAGIADPVSCSCFKSDVELKSFLTENGKFNGLECKLKVGGTAYRVFAPICSKPVFNYLCKPDEGIVKSCTFIGRDQKALGDWAKEFFNKALVTCKIKATGNTYQTLTRDCDDDTQRSACAQDVADPVKDKCKVYKNKAEMALSFVPKV